MNFRCPNVCLASTKNQNRPDEADLVGTKMNKAIPEIFGGSSIGGTQNSWSPMENSTKRGDSPVPCFRRHGQLLHAGRFQHALHEQILEPWRISGENPSRSASCHGDFLENTGGLPLSHVFGYTLPRKRPL